MTAYTAHDSDEAERLIERYGTRECIEKDGFKHPVLSAIGMVAFLGFIYWLTGALVALSSAFDHIHGITYDQGLQTWSEFRTYVFPVVAVIMGISFLGSIPATLRLRRWDRLVADGKILELEETPLEDDPPPTHESRWCAEGA